MKLSLLSTLLASTAAAVPHLEPRAAKYEGYKVLRMDTGDKLEDVKQMLSAFDYEEWSHDVSKHIDFSLPADQAKKLKGLGAKFTEMHSNLGKDIAYEGKPGKYKGKKGKKGPKKSPKGPKKPEPLPDLSWYDSYHSYDEHLEYLDDLAAAFPKNSEVFVAGHSLEGREQKGIHIWGEAGKNSNNAILWHGTVHAREWITTMTVEYLAYQLIAGYGKNANVTSFVDEYDFYLLPIVNPDGFVYTQTNDRLWRKNRAPPPPGSNNTADACWGVDLNRNWPHEWIGPGSSNNSCTQTYRGPSPGSEPEMSGMQHFADKLADSHGLKLFIDWHSYSQLILSPYGYSCEAVADTNDEHVDLMAATAEAIKSVEGTEYVYGPTCQTIYATNGGSSDYVYDISGSEWSLAFELRDTGTYGFILPPEQILPNCEEVWAGMQVMLSMI